MSYELFTLLSFSLRSSVRKYHGKYQRKTARVPLFGRGGGEIDCSDLFVSSFLDCALPWSRIYRIYVREGNFRFIRFFVPMWRTDFYSGQLGNMLRTWLYITLVQFADSEERRGRKIYKELFVRFTRVRGISRVVTSCKAYSIQDTLLREHLIFFLRWDAQPLEHRAW